MRKFADRREDDKIDEIEVEYEDNLALQERPKLGFKAKLVLSVAMLCIAALAGFAVVLAVDTTYQIIDSQDDMVITRESVPSPKDPDMMPEHRVKDDKGPGEPEPTPRVLEDDVQKSRRQPQADTHYDNARPPVTDPIPVRKSDTGGKEGANNGPMAAPK